MPRPDGKVGHGRPRSTADANARKKALWVESLKTTGSPTATARETGLDRCLAYDWRKADPAFAAAWAAALAIGLDALEDEALRRAKEGTLKPVFHAGEECGAVREYSDTLAIFLLKGGKPEKYRDRLQADIKADIRAEVSVNDVRAKLAAKLDALAGRQGESGADSESHA